MKALTFWLGLFLCGVMAIADARVVRPSPDFEWAGVGGRTQRLSGLRGQPVVLLIAPSPRDRHFRSQVRALEEAYQRFAAQGLVCIAAFTEEGGLVESNIPFIVAADGPRVGFLYEVPGGAATALIGPDGNLDYLTTKRLSSQRMLDVMGASFTRQEALRRP